MSTSIRGITLQSSLNSIVPYVSDSCQPILVLKRSTSQQVNRCDGTRDIERTRLYVFDDLQDWGDFLLMIAFETHRP